jgi:hypothetical protein
MAKREVINIDDTEENADWLKPIGKKAAAKAEKLAKGKKQPAVKEALSIVRKQKAIRGRTKREK